MLSKEEKTLPPNSLAYVPHHEGPVATLGPSAGGRFALKRPRSPPLLTVGKPSPCWYGPCVSVLYLGGEGGGSGGSGLPACTQAVTPSFCTGNCACVAFFIQHWLPASTAA